MTVHGHDIEYVDQRYRCSRCGVVLLTMMQFDFDCRGDRR